MPTLIHHLESHDVLITITRQYKNVLRLRLYPTFTLSKLPVITILFSFKVTSTAGN